MTTHPLRCRCGAVEAVVTPVKAVNRCVCYCRDCQAFAHYLGHPEAILDPSGGTDIVAVQPRQVKFLRGLENLTCMSLSPAGTLRWFAKCCRTPIGNTPRSMRLHHLGLIHNCLEVSNLTESFGPVSMRISTHNATNPVAPSSRLGFVLGVIRHLASLAWSRMSGAYRQNPLFDAATGAPRSPPDVISPAERDALALTVASWRACN